MSQLVARWESSGLLGRLAAKKAFFREPRASSDADAVLSGYSRVRGLPLHLAPFCSVCISLFSFLFDLVTHFLANSEMTTQVIFEGFFR